MCPILLRLTFWSCLVPPTTLPYVFPKTFQNHDVGNVCYFSIQNIYPWFKKSIFFNQNDGYPKGYVEFAANVCILKKIRVIWKY